jgi:hypothetical protein
MNALRAAVVGADGPWGLMVLTSPWLLTQLASLPGYKAAG